MKLNGTVFEFVPSEKTTPQADVLVVPLPAKPQPALELVARVDAICDDAVSEVLSVQALGDEAGHLAHTTRSAACRRVLLVSLGDVDKMTPQVLRKAAANAANWLIAERIPTAALWIDGLAASGAADAISEWAGGMSLGGFQFNELKAPDQKVPAKIRVLVCSGQSGHVRQVMPDIRDAVCIARAINLSLIHI